jgi:DNA-binding MarR family transcriptional regulator
MFALRTTAQQVDNALNEWMAGTVGSAARFKILMALWATKGKGIPHKDIVRAMGVTRATVSGLMAALESEGLVKSHMDREDRRKLIARLTSKGPGVPRALNSLACRQSTTSRANPMSMPSEFCRLSSNVFDHEKKQWHRHVFRREKFTGKPRACPQLGRSYPEQTESSRK